MVPARIGRYELERPLAHGGMAELFVARLVDDAGFARRVALKRALPELHRDRAFAEMFRTEARLAASLAHHNIVAVHDLGEDVAGFYLVMELLHGADVGSLLRAAPEPLPLAIVLAIASDACAGLHHAHERRTEDGAPLGIVHRDVSPQNLFVTFDGCTKLLDFGIAKAIDRIGDQATRTGTLRGKVPYMSPEQCRGEALDRRTDVFSLGIVLWELVTGERLYGARGESDFEVFKQIAEHDAPDPTTRRAATPPALARAIGHALARDRGARYPTIAALHDDLEALARGPAPASAIATPREVGAYLVARFPERAEAWRRGTLVDGAREVGAGAQVTAALPAARAASSAPLPIAVPGTRSLAAPSTADAVPIDFDVPATRRSPNAASITRVPTAPPVASSPAWRLPALLAGVAAVAIGAGYLVGSGRHASAPAAPVAGAPPPPVEPARAASPAPTEDAQWFQPDDYLVSEAPYANERVDYLRVAKLVGPRPAAPSTPARFLISDGRELATASYWSTRPATASDLTIGTLAFCHANPGRVGTTPADKQESRLGLWIVARVTDVSGLAAGRATVADADCPLGAIRVAVAH